jgi:hypothetical protein
MAGNTRIPPRPNPLPPLGGEGVSMESGLSSPLVSWEKGEDI